MQQEKRWKHPTGKRRQDTVSACGMWKLHRMQKTKGKRMANKNARRSERQNRREVRNINIQ